MVKGMRDPFLLHQAARANAMPPPPAHKRARGSGKQPSGTFRDPNMIDIVHDQARTRD
jgi:hypothetical protein